MGRRGPKPAPTALKIASGVRTDRVNLAEPKAVEGDPEPTIALSPLAQVEWDRLLPILRSMGVLSKGDGAALTIYCVTFGEWAEARKMIAEEGTYSFDDAGKFFVNPAIAVANRALDVMTRYIKEFGLTPSSRSSLKAVDPGDTGDEITEFKNRRRKAK